MFWERASEVEQRNPVSYVIHDFFKQLRSGEVFQQYGKKAFIDTKKGKVQSITYVMEKNKQGNYHVIPSFDHAILEGGFENMKGLSMNFDHKGRVSFIMLASHEFAYNPEFNVDDIQ
ncbi:hypothetical protein [Paenibacillus sp. UASWS1643]|uniref:hypothetical protein n=1 Tax=Paenibacillus sp. UASWS1643 TaxID=2580422 RepID=UPI001684DADA|nr:hypothetical protein [Paenibacillus sp. UASWS1643]